MVLGALVRALAMGSPRVTSDSATLCVIDRITQAPVVGAEVAPVGESQGTDALRTKGNSFVRARASCVRLPVGEWIVRRVGYLPMHVRVRASASASASASGAVTVAALAPVAAGVVSLDTMRSEASTAVAPPIARLSASLSVDAARATGAFTTTQLLERLPFMQLRCGRGETAIAVRGSRREQVTVTLDGLPLNDPATGVADVADLPLAALGSVTVALGADPMNSGPGASGGVLALTTAAQRVLSLRTGAFGQYGAEGAWSGHVGSSRWHAALSHRTADNDFTFLNTAGASGTAVPERRVNNDETRDAVSIGVIGRAYQFSLLASHSDRGMVGPANVHTYDADRARIDRVLLRGQGLLWRNPLVVGVRQFTLGYRDPTRPALNADARATAADVEWRGASAVARHAPLTLQWRVGGGADDAQATGGITQSRGRAFASSQAVWRTPLLRAELGARVDAIGGAGAQPSFSLAVERQLRAQWTLSARAAQSLRVPTLYDLYFASPQRLYVATLRPERVLLDAEVSSRATGRSVVGAWALDLAVVARNTRDAIIWFPGNFGWSPSNVGREQLRGLEARAQLLPRWGELSAWSTAYDAALITGALQIPTPYVPRLAAGSQWLVRRGRRTASVLTRINGRRPFSAGPRNRAYELPATALFDLAVSHPLPRQIAPSFIESRLTWSIENVSDVVWQSVQGFPAPGRTWSLGVSLTHTP